MSSASAIVLPLIGHFCQAYVPFRLIVDVWFRFLGDTFGTVPVGGRHLFRFLADTSGSVFGLVLSTRQRARLHLAEGLRVHVERLSSRAMSRSFRGHPSAVRRLGVDVRVVAGGLSGAGDVDADLVVADRSEVYVRSGDVDADLVVADRSEVYVRSGDVAVLVAEYGLEPSPMGEGNVVLRVLSEVWPFEEGSGWHRRWLSRSTFLKALMNGRSVPGACCSIACCEKRRVDRVARLRWSCRWTVERAA